jgi:hypothetical protein
MPWVAFCAHWWRDTDEAGTTCHTGVATHGVNWRSLTHLLAVLAITAPVLALLYPQNPVRGGNRYRRRPCHVDQAPEAHMETSWLPLNVTWHAPRDLSTLSASWAEVEMTWTGDQAVD